MSIIQYKNYKIRYKILIAMFSRMLCLKRRFNIYLKFIAIASLAIFYFAFLFRESLNAYEATKNKLSSVREELKHKTNPINKHQKTQKIYKNTINTYKYDENNVIGKRVINNIDKNNINVHNNNKVLEDQSLLQSSSVLQSSTLNPVYEYSDELHSATEKDLQNRKFILQDVCIRENLTGIYPPKPHEFFLSPGHNLVWCNIFKAASSTWMYYFNILGGYNIKYLQHTRRSPLELARKRFPRPKINELNDALESSISFLTVREPFERLLSAYRDKLEGCHNQYYRALGKQIIKLFRNKNYNNNNNINENNKNNENLRSTSIQKMQKGYKLEQEKQLQQQQQQKQCHNSGPTFKEFLLFLINNSKNHITFDEHWTPMYSFCTPCSINYTLIAKTETFQRDSEYIIRQAGLEPLLLDIFLKLIAIY
ncbi:carbohydrate sulfotransferase 11 isoform X2 [Condylostylus longicornis]|uniref:carbohydrate sulfotransferase 11 isoform X2 n=1 Tax=Condylostylus longicornis TaxID=2530218 RepID=UPI00244E3F88|nr:carbohydrate sulfotransferase 11 isoform X2 [Condylostylus longicornis]